MVVRLAPELCAGLRTAFERVGYDVDGVPQLLDELFALLAFSQDRPVGELVASVRELVRHGLLVPAEWSV
jgi:hypothetical protein